MRVPPPTWQAIFRRDEGRCKYCNQDLLASRAAFSSAQVDHVQAIAKGGLDELDNLKMACAQCNGSLSRYNHLTTFDERKAVLDKKNIEHEETYRYWVKQLRNSGNE